MIAAPLLPPSIIPELSISSSRDWRLIAPIWQELAGSSGASFFLSSSWVETWVETFATKLKPEFLIFLDPDGTPVGACLLVRKTIWRKGIPMRAIYLNCAGEGDDNHSTWIEFNHLLCLPGHEQAVADALAGHLKALSFDELVLQGVTDAFMQLGLAEQLGSVEVVTQASHYVDLDGLRASGKSYDQAISQKKRHQIRRGRELYGERFGPLHFSQAESVEEALEYLRKLARLHQITWRKRGKSGAFASDTIRGFHEDLVRRALPKGEIQLLKLTAGTETVGVLYNFIYEGEVYFYQSGFLYSDGKHDRHLRPGIVTIHQAVHHCLANTALSKYHFLAGDYEYKRSLGAAYLHISWLVARRETLRTKTFMQLRALWRRRGKAHS